MATGDQIIKSIEPGSIPSGDRGPLQQNIAQLPALGGEGQPAQAAPNAGVPSGADPLGALTSGAINPGDQGLPLTDGLSVGPGAGGQNTIPDDHQQRLALLVKGSRSPAIRSAARLALLQYSQEKL